MMRGGIVVIGILTFVAAMPLGFGGETNETPKLSRYAFRQIQMGVPFTLIMYAPDEARANRAAEAAFARAKELNAILSDYDPDSELRQWPKSAQPGEPYPISRELSEVLHRSQEIARKTNGSFDVTVGPLSRLWRIARRKKELPNTEAVASAMQSVGYRHLEIDADEQMATLKRPNMRFDLGGIAKGYAGDEMLRILREHGITRAMIDASGDLALGDSPPTKKGWTIAVAALDTPDSESSRTIIARNCGIATSGDAYNFLEIDGTRYSHIVDPRTGYGLTDRSSVTVIAKNGTDADAYASAISVLGPEKGLALARCTDDLEVLVAYSEAEEIKVSQSAGFPK
ncbi:FAD:protein FMN transferase [Stratiformator vulcanicus]|uniref:FAD:protein FMN transferase n=1 Tax=Stratiformator vulcanicus TaxID=2527980 RepID=A0A517R2G0_9PLAN|nr:FAD:protein FMN transferase [Stratiformator vulcanicus]QDT38067.1 Thiamine biosynthesis lipoprotein ApbE precursor [Stratiformator vulcanicus]